MSTRANIKLTDEFGDTLWFYRHSDGYPEGAMPTLNKFLDYVKDGKIRDNVGQAAGWLILLGHQEYQAEGYATPEPRGGGYGWKVGAIEPTTGEHGDIEWLYTINLKTKKITKKHV